MKALRPIWLLVILPGGLLILVIVLLIHLEKLPLNFWSLDWTAKKAALKAFWTKAATDKAAADKAAADSKAAADKKAADDKAAAAANPP